MALLACASAFCSGSEAALFSLQPHDRRRYAQGSRLQRLAAELLREPDALLTAVLFWNLLVNMTYFGLASVVSLRLEVLDREGEAGVFSLTALLSLIFVGEMFPKSICILHAKTLAALCSLPLSFLLQAFRPVLPAFRFATTLSRRLFWPSFTPEPYLELADLERAVSLSTTDPSVIELEQSMLKNILALSEIRAEEMMRPRTQTGVLRRPFRLADLEGRAPPGGYVLLGAEDDDAIVAAIPLAEAWDAEDGDLDALADDVAYVAWNATLANVLQTLLQEDRYVAAVVDEYGATLGSLSRDDILQCAFTPGPALSLRWPHLAPIQEIAPGVWQVNGGTSVRRLVRHLGLTLPPQQSATVGGVVQEILERLPAPQDRGRWGELEFVVLAAPAQAPPIVQLTRTPAEEDAS